MTPEELVTSRKETRAGFIAMALEKNALAVPYIEEAKSLLVLAKSANSARELLNVDGLEAGLLAASGLSNKALVYLDEEDKKTAIEGLIDEFLEPAGDDFAEELVYRYLLTKGDALGGQARNLAGALGDWKFFRTLISVLKIAGIRYRYFDLESKTWIDEPDVDAGVEKRIKALSWQKNGNHRLLIKNSRVPLIEKNVDLILLSASPADFGPKKKPLLINTSYLALGELKGGIDPAGSDEHWKTANFALNRIRGNFGKQGLNPATFFIGAAIETAMAEEVCQQIRAKVLTRAANLTNEKQLTEICKWLVTLG